MQRKRAMKSVTMIPIRGPRGDGMKFIDSTGKTRVVYPGA